MIARELQHFQNTVILEVARRSQGRSNDLSAIRYRPRCLILRDRLWLCISYGQTLSIDIATTARRLVMGPWYQRHWGRRVILLEDQASKENFATTAGGFRLATSMGGATLGRGGDIKILDDPNSVQQAESDIEREQAIRTYNEALATRETDPSTAAEVAQTPTPSRARARGLSEGFPVTRVTWADASFVPE
jgi:hypothetical protein